MNRVAPAGTLDAVLDETIAGLVDKSVGAASTVKALVARAFDGDLAGGLDYEARLVAEHMRTPMPRRGCAPSRRSAGRNLGAPGWPPTPGARNRPG